MKEGIDKYYDTNKKNEENENNMHYNINKLGKLVTKITNQDTIKCMVQDSVKRLKISTAVKINKNIKSIKKNRTRGPGKARASEDSKEDDKTIVEN